MSPWRFKSPNYKAAKHLLEPKDSSTTLSSTALLLPTSSEVSESRNKTQKGKKSQIPGQSPTITSHMWVYATGIRCTTA